MKGMSTKCAIDILTLEQYLSLKEGGYEFEGQSYLFWEYVLLLKELNPKYFLLENVMMEKRWENLITKTLGVKPVKINSALVSAQNRNRLYWCNFGLEPRGLFGDLESVIEQPKDKGILLKDILEVEVDEKYYLSDKMINYFKSRSANFNNGKVNIREEEGKASTLTASMASCDISDNFIKIDTNMKLSSNQEKANCFTAGGNSGGLHSDMTLICHNMQPRSGDPTKGDTGHLTRSDGKTYCLDTGNTNAVEIIGGDFRYDEGFRWRTGFKTGTLHTKESCGQFEQIDHKIRRLTPTECCRLQTVPDNYFKDKEGNNLVSETQQYKMLGNGWTIDVIAHLLSYLPKDII